MQATAAAATPDPTSFSVGLGSKGFYVASTVSALGTPLPSTLGYMWTRSEWDRSGSSVSEKKCILGVERSLEFVTAYHERAVPTSQLLRLTVSHVRSRRLIGQIIVCFCQTGILLQPKAIDLRRLHEAMLCLGQRHTPIMNRCPGFSVLWQPFKYRCSHVRTLLSTEVSLLESR